MACDVTIKNYKTNSLLYNELLNMTGNAEQATRLYLNTKSKAFKDWFGNGEVDENGEPRITNDYDNYNVVYLNENGDKKAVRNFGSFGRQYTPEDIIGVLQKQGAINDRRHLGKFWVTKGQTIDGENLLKQNLAKIRKFNKYYEDKYNNALVFVHKEGTSFVAEVNEPFLQKLNDRNKVDVYYASVSDPIEDIEASVINTGFSKVQGINVKQEAYIINVASNVLLRAADVLSNLTIEDALRGDTVRDTLVKLIKANSFARYTDRKRFTDKQLINSDQHNLNNMLANKIATDDLLWNKIKVHAKINSGISITEIEELNIDPNEVSNTFNENQQFFIPPDARISSRVKNLINNTVDIEQRTESIGGIPTVLNASDIIPHFIQNLSNSINKKDMLDKLKELAVTNAAYNDIHSKLQQDKDIANAFFSAIKSESPFRIINVLNKEATNNKDLLRLNVRNKESYIKYSLADSWLNTLKSRVASEFYINANLLDRINNAYNNYLNATATDKSNVSDTKINNILEFFSSIGFDITHNMLDGLINDTENRNKIPNREKVSGKYIKANDPINDYISSAILDTKLLHILKSIHSYINDVSKNPEFNGYGNILNLADLFGKHFIPETIAYINIAGNQEQTFNKPTFLGDWFNTMNDDEMFLAKLVNMVKDPTIRNSAWLLNTSNLKGDQVFRHDGFLNIPEDVTLDNLNDNLHKLTLNKSFYRNNNQNNFELYFYDGFTEVSNNQNIRYSDILDSDWAFVNFAKYISGNRFSEEPFTSTTNATNGMYPFINPADRANARDISAPIFELENKHLEGTVGISRNSILFKAVRNHFRSQVLRMEQARNDIYTIDEKGNRKYAKNEDLIVNYHYKRNYNPETGRVTISKVKNGRLVGDAFKFYNLSYMDSRGDTHDINDIFTEDVGEEVLKDKDIMTKVDNFLDRMISAIIKEQRDLIVPVLNDNKKVTAIAKTIKPINTLIAEYAINRYIANTEMQNFFLGDIAFYGSADAANKRAGILLSSGAVNGHYGTNKTYLGATVGDRIVSADIISNIETTLRKQNISEDIIQSITNPYRKIESTDGISYITLREFENRAKDYGVYDKYKSLFDKLNDENADINIDELNAFVQLQKNIYHSYEFDGKRMVPTQVKNSELVLIPRFLKGTELGAIHDAMIRHKLVQLNFASAEKVGSTYIGNITNKDGSLNLNILDDELSKATKSYYYKNLRKQQDIVNHIIDATNKHGTQLAKKILDNIKDDKIVDEVFQLTVANIVQSAEELKDELGIKETKDGYELNINKLSNVMLEQYIQQSKNNNYLFGAEVDRITNTFKLPLDMSVTRVKNESLFNSLFTNNVINQKHPGIHGPQASNAFMNTLKDKTTEDGTKPFKKGDTSIRPLKYSSFDNGKFQFAEVLLPAWSKKFFGATKNITIEDLQAAGLDQMLGYRIPTEGKQSMFVFKVVGFLDNSQGSSIVVPDAFVAQTGSDFDIDSIYTMSYNFNVDKAGDISKIKYHYNVEDAWQERFGRTKEFLTSLDNIIAKEFDKGWQDTTDPEVIKLLDAMIGSMPDEFTDEEIDDILKEKGYSLDLYNKLVSIVNTFPSKEEFIKEKNAPKFNTRKARQNRILDRYIEILSNPESYLENVTPNMFNDIVDARDLSNSLYNPASNTTNFASPTTQELFRRISLASRDLKGISVNGDSFVSIGQRIGLRLADNAGIQIQYNIDEPINIKVGDKTITIPSYTIKQLRDHFGKDKVTDNGIVTLDLIGNNKNGTFTNIEGKLITTYTAQATAHILDSVKDPLPFGVTNETVNIWRLIPSLGGSWTTATLFINQEAVDKVNKHTDSKNSISVNYRGYPIEGARQDLAKDIFYYYAKTNSAILNEIDVNPKLLDTSRKTILNNKRAFIDPVVLNQVLDLSINDITISDKFLIDQLKAKNDFVKLNDNDKIQYLRNQIGVLQFYNELSLTQAKINDFQALTSYDKSKVGPEFSDIAYLNELYEKVQSNDYDNILITKDGSHYIDAIYKGDSYPVLKAFKENGQDISYKVFNKLFITQSDPVKDLLRNYPKEQHRAVIDYVIAYNTSKGKFFDIADRARVLGMTTQSFENIDVTTITKEGIEAFKQLSATNKLMVIKNAYKEYIDDTNLLYYLTPVFTTDFVKKYNYTDVAFKSDKNDNIFIDSFTKLWYNNNIYVHLLAQDLVKLAFFSKGLTFGRNISKVIPAAVLYNEHMPFVDALGERLEVEGEPILHGVGYTTIMDKSRALHFEHDFNNVYDEKFRINFARSNWRNSSIVPKVLIETEFDVSANATVFKRGAINWRSKDNDGIITVSRKQFNRMPAYLRNADVVKDYYRADDIRLFAKVETTDAKGEPVYMYIPVNKLDTYEFDDKSVNPINDSDRVIFSYDEYISKIQINNDIKSTEFAEETIDDEASREYNILTSFETDKSSGYRNRTRLNATADATIAIAVNFDTAGEVLTKDMVELNKKLYIPIDFDSDLSETTLNSIVDKLNKQQVRTLNIAGNGIYTFSVQNVTQKQIDDKVYNILRSIQLHPNLKYRIEKIRSGGQTGVDEAGIKAARRMSIPSLVLAPAGWRFRTNKGDISNKTRFMQRFNIISDAKPTDHSMVYNMPSDSNIYGRNTTTIKEVEAGNRTATTRSYPLGKIGDLVTFNGRPTQYVITNVEQLTDKLVNNPKWIEEWSRKEGWTTSYFKSILGTKNTVKVGSYQTSFVKKPLVSDGEQLSLDFKAEVSDTATDDYIDYNKSRMEYAKSIVSDYNARLKRFPTMQVLRNTVKKLNNITWGDNQISAQLAAFRANIDYVDATIKQLEDRFYGENGYSKPEVLRSIVESEDRLAFSRFMNFANVFLKGFENIKNIEQVRGEHLTKEERSLNSVISKLKSYGQRVNDLQATHRTVSNTYFEKILTPLSTNPEIKLNIRQLFDIQDDESKIQLLMDSLADTNHSFVANFIKKFIIDRGVIRNSIRDHTDRFDKEIAELLKSNRIEDLIEKDNKLIQEFDDKYKEDWQNYRDNLIATEAEYGKYSKQYYKLEKEYINWRHENILSEEFKEVEKAKIEANDILYRNFTARKLVDELNEKKNRILANNDGLADYRDMNEEDEAALTLIHRQMQSLQNKYTLDGELKTGMELDIAETISAYSQAHGQIIEDYYTPVIANAVYKRNLKKHLKSNSKASKDWLARNTVIKLKRQFWNDFAYHSQILGRESMESAIKALNPFRDKDGVVDGNIISDKLRKVIKEANETRFKDVDGRPIKAIIKPETNEAYTDEYYDRYEKRGEDSRDNDEDIKSVRNEIDTILKKYLTDDGILDTTSISIEDLDNIIKLSYELTLLRSYSYQITKDRDSFNTWYRQTHYRETNDKAFNDAKSKALANGKAFYNRWLKLNTSTRLEDSYFRMIDDLRDKFNIRKSNKQVQGRGGIDIETVQKLYNVDSFDKLPADIIKKISKTKQDSYAGVIGGHTVYTLKDYIRFHVVSGKSTRFENIEAATDHIKKLYAAKIKREIGDRSKYFKFLDAYDAAHTVETTSKYKRLLKKYGEKSAWYINNHTINHRGEVIPVPYWTTTLPKDKSQYTENAPNSQYWSYSIVKDKKYVDKQRSASKKWMNDNVDFVETPYYTAKKAEMKRKSKEEYDKWFEDNHFYNPYTHQYQPIAAWTTMVSSDDYTDQYAPLPIMTTNEIKPKYSNSQESRDEAYDKYNAKPKNKDKQLEKIKLTDPYRSIHNRPLPRKSSKYYYDNRVNKNPRFKTYNEVKANPLYAYINNMLKDLTSHYDKDTILDEQQLPIQYKPSKDQAHTTAQTLLKKIGWYNYGSKAVVGENNESIRILNLPDVTPINKEQELDYPKPQEFATREEYLERYQEVSKHNTEVRKVNEEYNRANMETDFVKVLRSFINTAYSHRFMYEHEHEMRMALEEIRSLDLAKRRNLLQRLRNITREKLKKEQAELFEGDPAIATEKGIGSNLEQHFKSFMDMVFYGEFELDEGNWTKISRVMQNFTSAKGMWFNTAGAFNNVAYGLTQIALEQHAGYYFSTADFAKAQKLYISNMFAMMAEAGKDKSSNYINALIKDFDIIELQDELAISNNIELNKQVSHHLLSTNTMYILHHIGEHYMQNSDLIAMLISHRLVDGKIMSFADYTYDRQYNALMAVLSTEGKHAFDKFIEDNKYKDIYLDGKSELIRDFILQSDYVNKQEFLNKNKELYQQAKKEFNSVTNINGKEFANYPKLIDVYTLEDGRIAPGTNPFTNTKYDISQQEYELFRRKVLSVNQKIHGIYNKLDAGTMQKYGLGRLIIQFKKWMRPGWVKRFGSRVGKTHWNESRGEYETGMYVSAFRFLTKPINDNLKGVVSKEMTVVQALSNIMKDYGNYVKNIGLYWNTLNDTDKANIRRTIAEMAYFAAVGVIMWMLQGLAGGDDDDKKWAYALYTTDRLMTEILAYNPFYGFTNETRKLLRDPFAAMAVMDDIGKLIYTSLFERDEYYKGGVYHGESKLAVQWQKNIPLLNRWLRYQNIQDYAGYYKLY